MDSNKTNMGNEQPSSNEKPLEEKTIHSPLPHTAPELTNALSSEETISKQPPEVRNTTDIILAQISLFEISSSPVRHGYNFTFLKSRPILTLGSDPKKCGENAIILNDPSIQPKHASILWKEGKLYLQDEGTGETKIQEETLVANTSRILSAKNVIRLGRVLFDCMVDFPGRYELTQPVHPYAFSNSNPTVGYDKQSFLPASIAKNVQDLTQNPTLTKNESFQKDSKKESGFVIAEFTLVSLDAPYALPHHCEIYSNHLQFLIGRASHCDYQIEFKDKYVAMEQAIIQYSPHTQTYSIKNLVKENPIFINNRRISEAEALQSNDIIKLGIATQAPKIRFNLIQDEKNTPPKNEEVTPEVTAKSELPAHEYLFSEIVSEPQRGEIYVIGNNPDNTFYIQDEGIPSVLAEIHVPSDGDYFLIRKVAESPIPVILDSIPIPVTIHPEIRYGVNQCLKIGNYLSILNNQRTLPPEIVPSAWKKVLEVVAWCIVLVASIAVIYISIQKYWPKINSLISQQNLLKEYQKNVFYIMAFNKNGKSSFSGTGFLVTQKNAREEDIFYIITCKHVVQPWKFQEHQIRDKQVYNKNNELLGTLLENGHLDSYYLAIWPYNSQAISPEKGTHIFENSFTNLPGANCLGNIELFRLGKDNFQALDNGFQKHFDKGNEDTAILKLTPNRNWNYAYHSWTMDDKRSLDIGEEVIVLGYSLGDSRLLNKEGRALPVSAEGKLASDCQTSDFLEMNVNQTHGASGGPVINSKGKIIGMVAFSDKEKRLLYGIHGQILIDLMK